MDLQDSTNHIQTNTSGFQEPAESLHVVSKEHSPEENCEETSYSQLTEISPTTPNVSRTHKRWFYVLLVLTLMFASFLVGWRLMAYRWWPVLSPYVKQIVYSVIPSLEPEPIPQVITPYTPKADAKLHDPIAATDSLFYYFYFPTCPYCANYADMVLAGLPDEITLPDGSVSRVMMVAVNKHDEAEYSYMEAYYNEHGIVKNEEQNDQVVPSIVIGDRYLRGTMEIRDYFYQLLLSGEGLNTPLIDGGERVN